MAMPRIQVTNLHGYSLEQLAELAKKAEKPFTRQLLTAVVMAAKGIPSETIALTLNCSRVTVCRCINRWNERGLEGSEDHRGGSEGSMTEEMLADIDDVVRNKSPRDFGYCNKNHWHTRVLQTYIYEKYGIKYSTEWIRLTLRRLGHSYKRTTKRSTKANREAQASFKKGSHRSWKSLEPRKTSACLP